MVTDYEYDIISRRTKESSPDRGTLIYTYDLANNVTAITDGRDITATMTYDELERVSTKTYPNTIAGKDEDVIYVYDGCPFGLRYLCQRTDESGVYTYEYDAFGNPTQMTFTEMAGVVYEMGYVYDDGDHIIRSTYPSGRVVDYARDGVRRVEAIDTTLNGAPQNLVSGIQYRGDNQMTQCTYGNGLIDERQYDLQGRLTHQQLATDANAIIDERTYAHDKNSNILTIDTNVEDNGYQYDALDRLIDDAIDQQTPLTYTYDLNDNRLIEARADDSSEDLWDYQPGSNRLDVVDAVDRTDTPLPVLPDRELVYNDANRLFQLIEDGVLKASYFYNDQGQRTRKVIHTPGGSDTVTIFHYDHMGYLISETDESGNLIKDYIWLEGMTPVAQIDSEGGNETITYLYTDHLMTNRLGTDEGQAVVWRWEGEAFGETLPEELAGIEVNLRFPGQYFDQETNLHYNWNRYYDPALGRYITSDPVGLASGTNTYHYVASNPLIAVDTRGLDTCTYVDSDFDNYERDRTERDNLADWTTKNRHYVWEPCGNLPEFRLPFGGPPISICPKYVGYWENHWYLDLINTIREYRSKEVAEYWCWDDCGNFYPEYIRSDTKISEEVIDTDYDLGYTTNYRSVE